MSPEFVVWHTHLPRYALKLGALGEAAEAAFVLRDVEALSRCISMSSAVLARRCCLELLIIAPDL